MVIVMSTLKLTQIGNSLGVILPKELLHKFKLEKGDELFVTETPDGFSMTPHNQEFERQMELARQIMKENRAVLRELAKGPNTTGYGFLCP
jgi:putative addiction module antidote